ncbi:MAG: MgtC/SapB family protein [Planctomycetota bacterium]
MLDQIIDITPFSWPGILSALACGAIIGFERQILGKPVGIRTGMLICLSTYIFVAVAKAVASETTDPSRVVGQIITGVGFLGAGVMMSRNGLIIGVTSAAAIWILAAIGVTVASGYHLTGIKLAILGVVVLVGIEIVEKMFISMRQGVHAKLNARKED